MLVEAAQMGSGTTHHTTGKITAQHGLVYQRLIKEIGQEQAKAYYHVNTWAIDEFERLCGLYQADFTRETAFVYTQSHLGKLENELKAYDTLGIAHQWLPEPDLPIATLGAVGILNQARFNPMAFLVKLSQEVPLYENTQVLEIDGNVARVTGGSIEAEYIIFCTHYPMVNFKGGFFMKLYQHRSYVLALKDAQKLKGMYVDEALNGMSFRMAGGLLLAGGGDHLTGEKGGGYQEIREVCAKAYPKAQVVAHWAAQDTMSLDERPYIGPVSNSQPQWLLATGFNKWGMTGAMVASKVLCDLATTGYSQYKELFSPQRSMLHWQLIKNAYEGVKGVAHFAGPKCTHMGCRLKWNPIEHSWDCPCHGSRFDAQGKVLDNPAKRRMKI